MNCELEIAFHSYPQRSYSLLVQLVEREICNFDVGRSSRPQGAINKQLSQKKFRERGFTNPKEVSILESNKKDLDRESDLHIEIFGFIFIPL